MGTNTGAVAIIDALGFKAACSKYGFDKILERMKEVKASTEELTEVLNQEIHELPAQFNMNFFADTIVVAVKYNDKMGLPSRLLVAVMLLTQQIVSSFLTTEPRLSFRGCIGCGEMILEHPFYLGESYFEVAEMYEQAEGAFVWLTHLALKEFEPGMESMMTGKNDLLKERLPLLTESWQVPLKHNNTKVTRVLNPFGLTDRSLWEEQSAAIIATFDPQVSCTKEKCEHTKKFLDHILAKPT